MIVSALMRIRAFQGLRPSEVAADKVAALPYDVVDTCEARQLASGNPLSFLHVSRAEIDLPEGINPYDPAVYRQARENLAKLQSDGILLREQAPCFYLYRQIWQGRSQFGLVAVCHVDDYECDVIKKHEKTRQVKEDDRTALNRELSAHPEPVFLTYRDEPEITSRLEAISRGSPLFDFTAEDGVGHTVWRIPGGDDLVEAFGRVPCAYVADGHHRSASAWRIGRELRQANPEHRGDEDYNWFLAVLFPQSHLKILPYNRVVADLNGLSPEAFLQQLGAAGKVGPAESGEPSRPGEVMVYVAGGWYKLQFADGNFASPIEALDVSRLQNHVLQPILGIGDPRTDDRIDFVGGIRGIRALVERVDSGSAAVAFSMYPVTLEQLMSIADAGEIMPPKSTWFEPKLRSGLFMHTF